MSAPAPTRPLVLCADDYGMNAGISEAILRLAVQRRISAASCMSSAPGWPVLAPAIAAAPGGIAVGLHLTLTWGAPLAAMPRLAPDGRLPGLDRLLALALSGRLSSAEIRAEIDRQLDAFEIATGRAPDFVDGHQHVHVLPTVRSGVLAALDARGLAGRIWLRDPSDRLAAILRRRSSAGKAAVVAGLALGFRKQAASRGFASNRGFSGFSPFDPARDPAADMAEYLASLGKRPLVMCHPGLPDPAANGDDPIAPARGREYGFMASDAFGELLAERGIRLAPRPD